MPTAAASRSLSSSFGHAWTYSPPPHELLRLVERAPARQRRRRRRPCSARVARRGDRCDDRCDPPTKDETIDRAIRLLPNTFRHAAYFRPSNIPPGASRVTGRSAECFRGTASLRSDRGGRARDLGRSGDARRGGRERGLRRRHRRRGSYRPAEAPAGLPSVARRFVRRDRLLARTPRDRTATAPPIALTAATNRPRRRRSLSAHSTPLLLVPRRGQAPRRARRGRIRGHERPARPGAALPRARRPGRRRASRLQHAHDPLRGPRPLCDPNSAIATASSARLAGRSSGFFARHD